MQEVIEISRYRVIVWKAITDGGERELTESEKDAFMEAEKIGARYVEFDDFILNTSFVKEIVKETKVYSDTSSIPERRRKFLVSAEKLERKLLS